MSGSFESLDRQTEAPATAPPLASFAPTPVAQMSQRAGNQAIALTGTDRDLLAIIQQRGDGGASFQVRLAPR